MKGKLSRMEDDNNNINTIIDYSKINQKPDAEISKIIKKHVTENGTILYLIELINGTTEWKSLMVFDEENEKIEEFEMNQLGSKNEHSSSSKHLFTSRARRRNRIERGNIDDISLVPRKRPLRYKEVSESEESELELSGKSKDSSKTSLEYSMKVVNEVEFDLNEFLSNLEDGLGDSKLEYLRTIRRTEFSCDLKVDYLFNDNECDRCSFISSGLCLKCSKSGSVCYWCDQTPHSSGDKVFRCNSCERCLHLECLRKQGKFMQTKLKNDLILQTHLWLPNRDQTELEKYVPYNRLKIVSFDENCNYSDEIFSLSVEESGGLCYECRLYDAQPERILAYHSHNNEVEFLVKFRNCSYLNSRFVTSSWLSSVSKHLVRNFLKGLSTSSMISLADLPPSNDTKLELCQQFKEFSSIDRIIDASILNYESHSSLKLYIKWSSLPYDECTVEVVDSLNVNCLCASSILEEKLIEFFDRNQSINSFQNRISRSKDKTSMKRFEEVEQPKELQGGDLLDYQLDGVNWLLFKYYSRCSCILADEMGLGKTIQTIAFIVTIYSKHGYFPFLIIVPNATLGNWEKELKKWAPHLSFTCFYGSSESRRIIKDHDLFSGTDRRYLKTHIVLTTYDMILRETVTLSTIKWEAIIVDEGHRLKDRGSKLFKTLYKSFIKEAYFTLLLTGTPLQNTVTECLNLMQFLDDKVFTNSLIKELEVKFKNLSRENVLELHSLVRPYILRRTKHEVLREKIPDKVEIVIPVQMSKEQKELYKAVLTKNYKHLRKVRQSSTGSDSVSLNNILIQLRKLLNHPQLLTLERSEDKLVNSCGKLQVLSRILEKLKTQDRRVLIFSNMTSSLDILEEFCALEKYEYLRMDGSFNAQEKTKSVDLFNEKDSKYFIFLISTRAGGLGINLTTADTIIFYETDYNPHLDIQALSRAHRIGQQKKVFVYRLITKNSVEERILERAKSKLLLDHLIIKKLDNNEADSSLNSDEIDGILRAGVDKLFEEDENQKESEKFLDDDSLSKLLDPNHTQTSEDNEEKYRKEGIKNIFNVAKVWKIEENASEPNGAEHKESLEVSAPASAAGKTNSESEALTPQETENLDNEFWERVLGNRIADGDVDDNQSQEVFDDESGRKSRRRVKPVSYFDQDIANEVNRVSKNEREYIPVSEDEDSDSGDGMGDSDEDFTLGPANKRKRKSNLSSYASGELINEIAKEETSVFNVESQDLSSKLKAVRPVSVDTDTSSLSAKQARPGPPLTTKRGRPRKILNHASGNVSQNALNYSQLGPFSATTTNSSVRYNNEVLPPILGNPKIPSPLTLPPVPPLNSHFPTGSNQIARSVLECICTFCKSLHHKTSECPFIHQNSASKVDTGENKSLGILSAAAASYSTSRMNPPGLGRTSLPPLNNMLSGRPMDTYVQNPISSKSMASAPTSYAFTPIQQSFGPPARSYPQSFTGVLPSIPPLNTYNIPTSSRLPSLNSLKAFPSNYQQAYSNQTYSRAEQTIKCSRCDARTSWKEFIAKRWVSEGRGAFCNNCKSVI